MLRVRGEEGVDLRQGTRAVALLDLLRDGGVRLVGGDARVPPSEVGIAIALPTTMSHLTSMASSMRSLVGWSGLTRPSTDHCRSLRAGSVAWPGFQAEQRAPRRIDLELIRARADEAEEVGAFFAFRSDLDLRTLFPAMARG
jgi:hypothetical protein